MLADRVMDEYEIAGCNIFNPPALIIDYVSVIAAFAFLMAGPTIAEIHNRPLQAIRLDVCNDVGCAKGVGLESVDVERASDIASR